MKSEWKDSNSTRQNENKNETIIAFILLFNPQPGSNGRDDINEV